jgi:probable rRNA maturation factor
MNEQGDSSPSISTVEPAPVDSEPPERLSIAIVQEGGDWSAFEAHEEAIRAAAGALAADPCCAAGRGAEACIVLADDVLVRSLNHAYRGKDAPTNVLSFPFQEPRGGSASHDLGRGAPGPRLLGDIVLAVETILKEADEQGVAPLHHLQHLVVHGLLHLLGFDHEAAAQTAIMEGLEVQILATLGIADPYATNEGR